MEPSWEEKKFIEVIEQLKPIAISLNDLLQSERVTWNKVKWDTAAMEEKKAKIYQSIKEAEAVVERKKSEAQGIISQAKTEAQAVMSAVKAKHVQAESLLDSVVKFVNDVEKRRHAELSKSIPA